MKTFRTVAAAVALAMLAATASIITGAVFSVMVNPAFNDPSRYALVIYDRERHEVFAMGPYPGLIMCGLNFARIAYESREPKPRLFCQRLGA
jgi:hypothetical protein